MERELQSLRHEDGPSSHLVVGFVVQLEDSDTTFKYSQSKHRKWIWMPAAKKKKKHKSSPRDFTFNGKRFDEEMKESSQPVMKPKLKLCRQLSGQCVLKSPANGRTSKPKSGHIKRATPKIQCLGNNNPFKGPKTITQSNTYWTACADFGGSGISFYGSLDYQRFDKPYKRVGSERKCNQYSEIIIISRSYAINKHFYGTWLKWFYFSRFI